MAAPRTRNAVATREAILVAARERFAADGYEKATVRSIAAAAGIDPSLVIRYFGTKEGLLVAAADFDLRLPDLSTADAPGRRLAEHFLNRWEEDETFTALLHAAVSQPTARARIEQIFTTQLTPAITALAPDPATAAPRVALIASHVLGVALCRYVLRLPPVRDLPDATLTTWLGDTIQHYLTIPAPR